VTFLDAVRRTGDGDAVVTAGPAGLVLGQYRRLAAAAAADEPPRPTERETEAVSHRTVQGRSQRHSHRRQRGGALPDPSPHRNLASPARARSYCPDSTMIVKPQPAGA